MSFALASDWVWVHALQLGLPFRAWGLVSERRAWSELEARKAVVQLAALQLAHAAPLAVAAALAAARASSQPHLSVPTPFRTTVAPGLRRVSFSGRRCELRGDFRPAFGLDPGPAEQGRLARGHKESHHFLARHHRAGTRRHASTAF